MGLSKQIHLYSVGTDAFYNEGEKEIHKKLQKLYLFRKDHPQKWAKKLANKAIKKYKTDLVELLDQRLEDTAPRQLDPEALIERNIISSFESSLTRYLKIPINSLTFDLFIVNVFFFQVFHNIVRDGFMYNGEKYIYFSSSAGQIRTKKAVFIKESAYEKIKNQIMCGLTIDEINQKGGINTNKYLAYLSLSSSATEVWHGFDIDRAIVVDDFETKVKGVVDFIDHETYEIERKEMEIPIAHADGAGIMLDDSTRIVRLPFIKGLMIKFPFDKFIQEKCPGGRCTVTDIYGKEHDIIGENIKYIFTKSQFKLCNYFDSFEVYKENFKKYQCEAAYCKEEEENIPKARINYQMLQTLSDIRDKEIDVIIKDTVDDIESIGRDVETTKRLLGATENNKHRSYFQEALYMYTPLIRDQYCREMIKQTKKSLVKQAKAGRIKVNGEYRFVSPDLYAFCEWLFLGIETPDGLLEDGEVYVQDYRSKAELACLRSPHLYKEWAIRKNKKNDELNKWFGDTKCVYTSTKDLISKILQFDVDGDMLLIVQDPVLTRIAKRNMKGIVPLYYEMKKAKPGILSNESIYQGMARSFTSGNIGPISNLITIVYNNNEKDREEALKVVKWLTMEVNFTIDSAKTLYFLKRPKEVDEIIKKHTKGKTPYFFIFAKDKEESQVERPNKSAMNRIAAKIPPSRVKFNKFVDKSDYRMFMNPSAGIDLAEDSNIIKSYDYWNARQGTFNQEELHSRDQDLFKYKQIRKKIETENPEDIDYIVNTLVSYLYTVRPNSSKKTLWAAFGDIMCENLKNNLEKCAK